MLRLYFRPFPDQDPALGRIFVLQSLQRLNSVRSEMAVVIPGFASDEDDADIVRVSDKQRPDNTVGNRAFLILIDDVEF